MRVYRVSTRASALTHVGGATGCLLAAKAEQIDQSEGLGEFLVHGDLKRKTSVKVMIITSKDLSDVR